MWNKRTVRAPSSRRAVKAGREVPVRVKASPLMSEVKLRSETRFSIFPLPSIMSAVALGRYPPEESL